MARELLPPRLPLRRGIAEHNQPPTPLPAGFICGLAALDSVAIGTAESVLGGWHVTDSGRHLPSGAWSVKLNDGQIATVQRGETSSLDLLPNTHAARPQGNDMTRIEAIARLRELADKLEAATDAPHDGHEGFRVEMSIHSLWGLTPNAERDIADYWIVALAASRRSQLCGGTVYYVNDDTEVTVFICDSDHQLSADLLANRDVQIVAIGGAE